MTAAAVTDRALRAETRLLLHCARTVPGPADIEGIRQLVREGIDWPRLTAIGTRHEMLPLLYQNLNRVCRAAIPDATLRELRTHYLENTAQNLLLAEALSKLLDLFASHQIPVIPYKGLTVARMAYGNLSLRRIGDLDLLVRPCDYRQAQSLLRSQGLRLSKAFSWESSFTDDAGRIHIDLHKFLTSANFPICLDLDYLQGRLGATRICDRLIPSPLPDTMLIILCIQIAKDGWEGRHGLKKICDVAALLHACQRTLAGPQVLEEAGRLGCQRILLLGLRLAHELLDAPLPVGVPARLLATRSLRRLSNRLCADLFEEYPTPQPDRLSEARFYFEIRERWRDRLNPYWKKRAFVPNEIDKAFVALPASLSPLYYAVRPVRLARDYGLHALNRIKRLS